MDKFLEELKAQRKQIKAHLDWLDTKIATQESTGSPASPPPPPSEPAAQATPEIATEPAASAPEEAPQVEFSPSTFGSSTGSDIKKLQVGCTVIFVVATAIFVFLLFGLPKLINKDEPTSEDIETEVELIEKPQIEEVLEEIVEEATPVVTEPKKVY